MTTSEFQAQVRALLDKRYPDYASKPNGERVLLAMASLANDFHVHESGGNNHGSQVEAILGAVHLGAGFPWCAASIEFCCDIAGVSPGPSDRDSAAVVNWRHWAVDHERGHREPLRGRLATRLNSDGSTGHMGIVAEVMDGSIRTYEGNTSPNSSGSQRDGDVLCQKVRPDGYFTLFIDLN